MTAPFVLNVPSKPQSSGVGGGRNQKDRRHVITMFDQHKHPRLFPLGRPWCGPVELAANRDSLPTPHDGFVMGDLMRGQYFEFEDGSCDRASTLQSGWEAPWTPLAKYFKYNYKRNTINLQYQVLWRDEDEGLKRYYKAASKLGIQLNIRVEPGIIPHPQIVTELGEPSRIIKLAEAAMAGDPWLLGWIDEPNPTLAEILNIHAVRGIPAYQAYEPPEQQPLKVEAVLAAPINQDLLEMLANMQKSMLAMQQEIVSMRQPAPRAKDPNLAKKIKDGKERAKQAREAAAMAEAVAV